MPSTDFCYFIHSFSYLLLLVQVDRCHLGRERAALGHSDLAVGELRCPLPISQPSRPAMRSRRSRRSRRSGNRGDRGIEMPVSTPMSLPLRTYRRRVVCRHGRCGAQTQGFGGWAGLGEKRMCCLSVVFFYVRCNHRLNEHAKVEKSRTTLIVLPVVDWSVERILESLIDGVSVGPDHRGWGMYVRVHVHACSDRLVINCFILNLPFLLRLVQGLFAAATAGHIAMDPCTLHRITQNNAHGRYSCLVSHVSCRLKRDQTVQEQHTHTHISYRSILFDTPWTFSCHVRQY